MTVKEKWSLVSGFTLICGWNQSCNVTHKQFLSFQWKVNVTEMEELQGNTTTIKGENTTQQHHLEGMAHAV